MKGTPRWHMTATYMEPGRGQRNNGSTW